MKNAISRSLPIQKDSKSLSSHLLFCQIQERPGILDMGVHMYTSFFFQIYEVGSIVIG